MKFVIYLLASFFSLGNADVRPDDGWFSVEKRLPVPEQFENDPSIWVLFAKDVGSERLQVRLPGDPTYQYEEDGSFRLYSTQNGESFELGVYPADWALAGEGVSHAIDGKWVSEQIVRTEHHCYLLKTVCKEPFSPQHMAFISSLSIEEN